MRRVITIWALIGMVSAVLLAALDSPRHVIAGSSAKDRGAELFAAKGCAFCHGPAGVGGGLGPDLQLVRQRRKREQIVAQIHDGSKSMPNFGDKLSVDEINDLATFLLSKRKYIPAPPKPASVSQSPARLSETN